MCVRILCCCKQEPSCCVIHVGGPGNNNNRKDFQSRGLQLVVCVYLHRCKMCAE